MIEAVGVLKFLCDLILSAGKSVGINIQGLPFPVNLCVVFFMLVIGFVVVWEISKWIVEVGYKIIIILVFLGIILWYFNLI